MPGNIFSILKLKVNFFLSRSMPLIPQNKFKRSLHAFDHLSYFVEFIQACLARICLEM